MNFLDKLAARLKTKQGQDAVDSLEKIPTVIADSDGTTWNAQTVSLGELEKTHKGLQFIQEGYTKLHLACLAGDLDSTVEYLKSIPVDTRAGLKDHTALQIASREGFDELVHVLLKSGAQVNAKNGAGGTALQAASVQGRVSTVKILLANGANKKLTNDAGKTPREVAAAAGQLEVLKVLDNA